MAAAGIETLGVAIVNGVEIATAMTSGTPPRILTLIHTENDSIEHVRGGEMARAAAVLERFVRSLDAPK
jgi:hypothetical protein